MARLPKPAAVLRPGRPVERAAPEIAGDLAETLRLLGHARLASVKLQEQHRCLRQGQFGIAVAGPDLQRIKELDAGDRNARLDGEDRGLAAGLDAREWADA